MQLGDSHLELNVTAFRQLHLEGPHIAVIPLHLRSITDIPISQRWMTSYHLVAFPKGYLHLATSAQLLQLMRARVLDFIKIGLPLSLLKNVQMQYQPNTAAVYKKC